MDELAPPISAEAFLAANADLMEGQSPRTILLRALWVLRDPSRWVNYTRAADVDGRAVAVDDPDAVRWSIEGAVAMASNPHGILPQFFMKLLDDVSRELYQEDSVNCLEDYCDHAAVVRVLLRAIERTA